MFWWENSQFMNLESIQANSYIWKVFKAKRVHVYRQMSQGSHSNGSVKDVQSGGWIDLKSRALLLGFLKYRIQVCDSLFMKQRFSMYDTMTLSLSIGYPGKFDVSREVGSRNTLFNWFWLKVNKCVIIVKKSGISGFNLK